MEFERLSHNEKEYLYVFAQEGQLATEQDALDVVSLCGQEDVRLVLFRGDSLDEGFYRLRTGIAGAMIQKWIQYSVRVALTLEGAAIRGKFEDFLLEANRGKDFRAYESRQEAVEWLTE